MGVPAGSGPSCLFFMKYLNLEGWEEKRGGRREERGDRVVIQRQEKRLKDREKKQGEEMKGKAREGTQMGEVEKGDRWTRMCL